jgi:hypothetical protein
VLVDDEIIRAEAEEYVAELVDHQLLVSDARPVVTGDEPVHGLVATLRAHAETAGIGERLDEARAALEAIDAAGLGASLDDLERLPPGTILHWEFTHFVVFERLWRSGVQLMDPALGRRRLSWMVPRPRSAPIRVRVDVTGASLAGSVERVVVESGHSDVLVPTPAAVYGAVEEVPLSEWPPSSPGQHVRAGSALSAGVAAHAAAPGYSELPVRNGGRGSVLCRSAVWVPAGAVRPMPWWTGR